VFTFPDAFVSGARDATAGEGSDEASPGEDSGSGDGAPERDAEETDD